MAQRSRSAPGPAAGYHFQIQRALLSLLAGPADALVSIETLDDLVIDDNAKGATDFEQLKHSLNPGALSDRSRPLWKALDAWMDLIARDELEDVAHLILVATDHALDGSAAQRLRDDERVRDTMAAESQLLNVAAEDGAVETRDARKRFASLEPRQRRLLLAKIVVRDRTPGVTGFRDALRDVVGLGMPGAGGDLFLDQVVGWWERRAVDLLVGRRRTVSRDEAGEEIARLRDGFSPRLLPDPDPDLGREVEIGAVLLKAYAGAPFVEQLRLITTRDRRVQLAIRDFHRAFTQRSRWLQGGVLAPDELRLWEERLVDEWEYAWEHMLEGLTPSPDDDAQATAALALLSALERSILNPLRDGRDRFIHIGTLHGLADDRRVGWHPDFEARLLALLGPRTSAGSSDDNFAAYGGTEN